MSSNTFINKVHRRLVHIARRIIQRPRIIEYQMLSSTRLQGKPILHQPLQSVGLGVIEFSGKVNIGVFPSPFFFSTYAYIEARNSTAKVSIGDGTWINNGFSAIAEHTSICIGQRVMIGTMLKFMIVTSTVFEYVIELFQKWNGRSLLLLKMTYFLVQMFVC